VRLGAIASRRARETLEYDREGGGGKALSPKRSAPNPLRLSERVAEQVADAMFALSTPSRVHILACLLDGPHTVSELMEMLGMEQSAVSHQLRILREHTLVKVERRGRQRVYSLYDEHVVTLLDEALRHAERRTSAGRSFRARKPADGAARGTG
jgi:DNA-binding transcriptional ArsR family regulator